MTSVAPLVGEPAHAESVELGAVRRPGVPPHIVTAVGQIDRDRRSGG